MLLCDYLSRFPDDHIRIIRYVPAPDVLQDDGTFRSGGEGTSTVVFDSTTGAGDLAPDLLFVELSDYTVKETDDGSPLHIVEYIPDYT